MASSLVYVDGYNDHHNFSEVIDWLTQNESHIQNHCSGPNRYYISFWLDSRLLPLFLLKFSKLKVAHYEIDMR